MAEVDRLAGPRGRSAFVAAAVEEAVKRERLRQAIEETRGVLAGSDTWGTADDVVPLGARAARRPRRVTSYLLDTTLVIDHAIGLQTGVAMVARLFEETRLLYTCDIVTCEALSKGEDEERRAVVRLLDALEYVAARSDGARWAGEQRRRLAAAGRKHPVADSLIAAIAWRMDATVVTRNAADFALFEVPVLGYGG